jgi:alkylation response protein AidB-like acyl-CoA dehydrogenase
MTSSPPRTPLRPPPPPGSTPALDLLLSDIRRRRQEFEQQRFISPDIIQRFKEIGVYRALVPTALGGEQKSAHEFCELIETISQADGSAGWVASFGMGVTYLAALPPPPWPRSTPTARRGVRRRHLPPQRAPKVDGGYQVSGRWSFPAAAWAPTWSAWASPRSKATRAACRAWP